MSNKQVMGLTSGERTTSEQIIYVVNTTSQEYEENTQTGAHNVEFVRGQLTSTQQKRRDGVFTYEVDDKPYGHLDQLGNSLTQNSPEIPKRNKPLGECLPQRQDSTNTDKPARTSLFMKPMNQVGIGPSASDAQQIYTTHRQTKRESQIPLGHLANLKKMRSKEFSESNLQSYFKTSNLRLDSEISIQSSPFHKASESDSTISKPIQSQKSTQRHNSKTKVIYDSQPQTKRQDSTEFRYKNSETPSARGSSAELKVKNTKEPGLSSRRSPTNKTETFSKYNSQQGVKNEDQDQYSTPKTTLPRFMQHTTATNSKDNREMALRMKQKVTQSRFMRSSNTETNLGVLNRNLRSSTAGDDQIPNPTIVYEESQKSSSFSNISRNDNRDLSEVIPVYLQGDQDADFGDQMEKDINRLRSPQGPPSNAARRSTIRKMQNQKFQLKENSVDDSRSRGSMMEVKSSNLAQQISRGSMSGLNIGIQRGHPKAYVEPERIESSKVNDEIEIMRISRKIRKVITTVCPEQDKLTSENIQQCLMELGYLPFISNQSTYECANYNTGSTQNKYQDEIDRAGSLFLTFILYINPLDKPEISCSLFIEFLSLIMMNITKLSEAKLVEIITEYVMTQLRALGINLMSETIPEEQESTLINAIPEEDDTKAKKIFNEFTGEKSKDSPARDKRAGATNLIRNGIDVREYYGLEELQIVNKFIGRYENTLTVQKFVKGFKHDHAERFAFKSVDKAKKVRLLSPQIASTVSKRAAGIIPQNQNRVLKDSTVRQVLEPYTFSPKITKYTSSIAKSRQTRRINQMTESRTQATLASQAASTGTLALDQKYYLSQFESKMREKKLQQLRMELDQKKQEEEGCTFSPRVNKKAFAHVKSRVGQSLYGFELKNQLNQGVEIQEATTYKFAKNQQAEKEAALEAECTFRPYFAAARSFRSKSTLRIGPKSKCLFETVKTDKGESILPKGFDKYVTRQRNKQVEKEEMEKKLKRESSGNRYQRSKLQNVKPPSFIIKPNNTEKSKRKDVLVSLDIKITPTRTGKLSIKKGDEVETIAKNFCMAYQLKPEMQEELVKQLKIHLQSYHEQQEAENLKAQAVSPTTTNKTKATRKEQLEHANKLAKKSEVSVKSKLRITSPETAPRPAFSSPARTARAAVAAKAAPRLIAETEAKKAKAAPKRSKASVEYEQKLRQIRDMQKILRGEQTQAAAEAEQQRRKEMEKEKENQQDIEKSQAHASTIVQDDRLKLQQKQEQVVRTTSSVAPLDLEVVVSQPQLPQEEGQQSKRDQRLSKMFERLNNTSLNNSKISNKTDKSHQELVSTSQSKHGTKQVKSSKHMQYVTGNYSTQTVTKTIITKTWVPGTVEESTTEVIDNGGGEGQLISIQENPVISIKENELQSQVINGATTTTQSEVVEGGATLTTESRVVYVRRRRRPGDTTPQEVQRTDD